MTWVDKLTKEYSEGIEKLKIYREKLDITIDDQVIEYQLIGGMISDMNYALEWMRRGRRPGNRRGIERRSVYQRTALLDPELFPSTELDLDIEERRLTDLEKRKIVDLLWELSTRERECYLLHMAHGLTYAEIAAELNISRRTVQQYVERAKIKIKNFFHDVQMTY